MFQISGALPSLMWMNLKTWLLGSGSSSECGVKCNSSCGSLDHNKCRPCPCMSCVHPTFITLNNKCHILSPLPPRNKVFKMIYKHFCLLMIWWRIFSFNKRRFKFNIINFLSWAWVLESGR
jgi:hypothetical protein